MDFMSILGRCLLLPFPVAMFVGCLFPGIDDRFTGMFMSFIVGCLSWGNRRIRKKSYAKLTVFS
ncbi:hypothetical protein [Escherichia coli]|uniref:hypothetical protein n=1 Tax=Escherichia coli TaxID=562 RepID=UPI00301CAF98